VTLRASIPTGLTLVSAEADRGSGCSGTQTVVCAIGTLTTQASTATVTLTLRATRLGQFPVPLIVSGSPADTNLANNDASVSVAVTAAGASPRPTVRRVGAATARTVQARRTPGWVSLSAAVQARNATSMLVTVSRVGSTARLTLLKGSKVGATTARRSLKSISIRPGTATRQLALRLGKAAIVKGRRYVIVVTVRNTVGSRTIRIPVRG
jgi:hypothetical protein